VLESGAVSAGTRAKSCTFIEEIHLKGYELFNDDILLSDPENPNKSTDSCVVEQLKLYYVRQWLPTWGPGPPKCFS